MKITNFRCHRILPSGPWYATALVDVTTGWWPFLKTKTRAVVRSCMTGWVFLDTGRPAPWRVAGLENTHLMDQRYDSLRETFRTRRSKGNPDA